MWKTLNSFTSNIHDNCCNVCPELNNIKHNFCIEKSKTNSVEIFNSGVVFGACESALFDR